MHLPPLFVALACSGNGSPPAPATPEPDRAKPAVSPADPAGLPSPDALLAAGACPSIGEISSVNPLVLSDGQLLLEIVCEMGLYQGRYDYAWPTGPRPVLDAAGKPLDVLGLPDVDTVRDELTWLEKARGTGDCGTWHRYRRDGDRLVLAERRARDCGGGYDESLPPENWPLVVE